jgi:hypothetical protein
VRVQDVFLGADDALLAASDSRRGAGPELLVPNLHRIARERGAALAALAPGHGNYRPDAHTATLGLELLRRQLPRFLFLGLGDTDEYAHRGNYAGYLDALGFADSIVGQLDAELEVLEARGVSTLLVVTTDHGRGRGFAGHGGDPASARVWLVASGSLVTARGSLHASRPLRLADIAPTFRLLFGLSPDESPKAGKLLSELLQPRNRIGRN